MATAGYKPTRDEMRAIVGSARNFKDTVERWVRCSGKTGFRLERGTTSALHSLFQVERALNPHRYPVGDRRRRWDDAQVWDDKTLDGLCWFRDFVDIVLEDDHNQLRSMATARDFARWLKTAAVVPATVRFPDTVLDVLQEIVDCLPSMETLPEDLPAPKANAQLATHTAVIPEPSPNGPMTLRDIIKPRRAQTQPLASGPHESEPQKTAEDETGRAVAIEEQVPTAFVPNKPQKRILAALSGAAFKGRDLAREAGTEMRELRRNIKELKANNLVVRHRRIGFYRPDSPPQELCKGNFPTPSPT